VGDDANEQQHGTAPDDGWGAVPRIEPEQHDPYAPPAWRPTPRRRLGRGGLIGIVAGGVALVLVIVAVVVGGVVGRQHFAPERTVQAFLADVEHGRIASALRTGGISAKGDPLLTATGYAKASHRVTSSRIVSAVSSGSTAVVKADLDQGGTRVPATFRLDRTGTAWGVFPVWSLEPVSLGAVDVLVNGPAGTPVTIAGQKTTTGKDGTVTLAALPGSYDIAVTGSRWFQTKSATATVSGFGGTASSPIDLTTTLTDAGSAAATTAVNAWVDGCVASTDLAPKGCSFYAYGEDPSETYSNQKWTLNTRPAVSVGDWTSDGWLVETTTPGSATYTASFTGPSGAGTGTAGPISFLADGLITGFTDAGATFTPAVSNDAGGDAGS
jgi:hypothetical protein